MNENETAEEKAMRIFQEWDSKRWQPQINMLNDITNKLSKLIIASTDRDGLAITSEDQ